MPVKSLAKINRNHSGKTNHSKRAQKNIKRVE